MERKCEVGIKNMLVVKILRPTPTHKGIAMWKVLNKTFQTCVKL